MFGKRREKPGLYRGDAAVTVPGMDGAEPTAYVQPATPMRRDLTEGEMVAEAQRVIREADQTLKESGYDPSVPLETQLKRLRRKFLLGMAVIIIFFGLPVLFLVVGFVASLVVGR